MLVLLSLISCALFSNTDDDRDGIEAPADCNDKNAQVYPGANEICDGVDNDCDGTVDVQAKDVITWYADADNDGYGNKVYTSAACTQPVGYVNNSTDCNDNASAAYPGHIEVCDGLDNNCDGTIDNSAIDSATWYIDADNDGYGSTATSQVGCAQPSGYVNNSTDCNDASNIVYPTAPELCDSIDNDCDGDIDGDATNPTTFYLDADGDTFGGKSFIVAACVAPGGSFVTNNTDCDDLEPTAFPGGVEVCDGVDNNCDAQVDNNPTDPLTFYADTDKDGYGDRSTAQTGCAQPSGYVSDKTDCNDTSVISYPGAPETCDNLDNDCDGSIDENASNATVWHIDIDGDGFGAARFPITACAAPSGYVNNKTDCDDVDIKRYPGATEVCRDGRVNNCNTKPLAALGSCRAAFPTRLSSATSIINGTATNDYAGASIDGTGDFNGDGFSDVLVGADGISSQAGAAYLYLGSISGTLTLSAASRNFTGISGGDRAGFSVHNAGDVNRDTYDDILIGAPDRANKAGAVYLVMGGTSITSASLSSAGATFTGVAAGDQAGYSVSTAGDINGDKYADVIVGAPGASSGAGAAYIIKGNVRGTLAFSASDVIFTGTASGDGAGVSVSGAGDVNGDGFSDVIIGADGVSSSTGAAYVSLGGVSGTLSLSKASMRMSGVTAGDKVGASVSSAGDFDGDGYADLIIGAPGHTSNTGAAYLVKGSKSPSSVLSLSAADITFTGISTGDLVGSAVSDVGDVNGDTYGDIAVGAPGHSTDTGITYLYYGNNADSGSVALSKARVAVTGTSTGDKAGSAVSGATDVDGDGISDVLISAEARSTNTGAVYLLAPFAAY
ncbi:MAG: MopE-related protein [Myxococcota bacterium]